MIAYNRFAALLGSVPECESLDWFIAECGSSAMNVDENVEKTIALLKTIWTLGRDGLSVESIMQASGRSLLSLSKDYALPYRTMQDWKLGNRKPPEWQLPLIAYAVLSDYEP